MLGFVLIIIRCVAWGICSILLFLIINVYSETFPFHYKKNRLKNSDSIRVLTYNINRAYSFSKNERTTRELVDFILKQNADLIFLQEYNCLLYPELKDELNKYYHFEIQEGEGNNRFKSVLCKYPIEGYVQLKTDINGKTESLPVCSMIIKINNIKVRFVNCHLQSNNYSVVLKNYKNNILKLLYKGIPLLINNLDTGYMIRRKQTEVIMGYLENKQDERIVVCGDFNDINGSSTLYPLKKMGLKDAWWKGGKGFGFTYHGYGLRLRLDHVLFSERTLKLINVCVPHSRCSDHNPVVCDFSLIPNI